MSRYHTALALHEYERVRDRILSNLVALHHLDQVPSESYVRPDEKTFVETVVSEGKKELGEAISSDVSYLKRYHRA